MIKRTTSINMRCDFSLVDDVEKLVKSPQNPTGAFDSVSQAIRECAKVGMKVHNYQEMMKDPERANEFREKMQLMIKNDEVFDWVATLERDQIDGFLMALQMEKDQRYRVSKLV